MSHARNRKRSGRCRASAHAVVQPGRCEKSAHSTPAPRSENPSTPAEWDTRTPAPGLVRCPDTVSWHAFVHERYSRWAHAHDPLGSDPVLLYDDLFVLLRGRMLPQTYVSPAEMQG